MRDYISPEEYAETQRANAIIDACYGTEQEQRADGYQNMLTKYGTKSDSSTAFHFVAECGADTYTLSTHYRFNGLFAKIIDLPAEEAVAKGFKLNINDESIEREIMRKLNDIGWEETTETAIKWSRLYGGAVVVMLINDGRGIDEPLNYRTIRGIDELRVYESSIVSPIDYAQSATTDPELLYISSMDGTFVVHTSRCLIFRNGRLPEMATDWQERMFGCPEYDRIRTALRECVTTHGYAPRLLERAIQVVFSIKNLAEMLSTEDGEDRAVKRLELIDMARSMFNSVAIDADGESFDFKTAPYTGTKEIIDSTCNMLSAVTNIPQALLFGSSPQGMDATGMSDLENYYNYVGQIQKRMVRSPLNKLVKIVMQALLRTGRIQDYPDYELEFNPMWSLTEQEQANVDQLHEQIKLAKAQTAQVYTDIGALDPSEIRVALSKEGEYDVETILDNVSDDDLFDSILGESNDRDLPPAPALPQQKIQEDVDDVPTAAAVIVLHDGKLLCGVRNDNDQICGPGGHIEDGEAPIQTAIRETQEEFGITPVDLMYMGTQGENGEDTHCTAVYLCTSFSGTPKADGKEMHGALFLPPDMLGEQFGDNLFPPFADSLKMPKPAQIMQTLSMDFSDGCGIMKQDQDGPGAPIGNDNAAKDHVKQESGSESKSGAVSGARNPDGKAAKAHAKRYYAEIRSRHDDVDKIAQTTGRSPEEIEKIKRFVFIEEHDLGENGVKRFEPDYMMAESWRRLIDGTPEPHDLVLIEHEIMESKLMESGMSQDEAHIAASKKHNYGKEAKKYYGKIKKYKKEP